MIEKYIVRIFQEIFLRKPSKILLPCANKFLFMERAIVAAILIWTLFEALLLVGILRPQTCGYYLGLYLSCGCWAGVFRPTADCDSVL